MRDLKDVVDSMICVIPESEGELIDRLRAFADSSMYAPPETQQEWWGRVADTLDYHIPERTEEWHHTVGAIFRG